MEVDLTTVKKDVNTNSILRKKKIKWTNYLYIVPIVLFSLIFVYYTLGYTIFTSFFDWNGISPTKTFVGLKQYLTVFQDPVVLKAITHTFIFLILTISIQMFLGVVIAVVLQFSRIVLAPVYKVIFFLPTILSPAIISTVFSQILDANNGQLNHFLQSIGLSSLAFSWLANPKIALYSLVGMNIWEFTGFSFILYYAALTLVDKSLFEAAKIDGATTIQVFRFITLPSLRSTHFTLIILGIMGSLQTFDIVWLTTGGGPAHSTEFMATYIFSTAVMNYNAGYGSALSVVLLLIALCITFFQMKAYQKN